jgi:DnaJ-class molecular chaperone
MDINGLGPTPYSDLGVSFNASEAEINAAHGTAMCRITFDPFDPDPGAQQAMDTLWEAMNILGDEHLKRIYDIW